MNGKEFTQFHDILNRMRREFDDSFKVPAYSEVLSYEDFLSFYLGADLFAVSIKELTHVEKKREIVPFHHQLNPCLGICGIQGKLIPTFDLARLMNYPPEPLDHLNWILVSGTQEPFGLALREIKGYRRFHFTPGQEGQGIQGAFFHDEKSYSIIKIDKLLTQINKGLKL